MYANDKILTYLVLMLESLKQNLEDPNFVEFVKNYDISILSEARKAGTSLYTKYRRVLGLLSSQT